MRLGEVRRQRQCAARHPFGLGHPVEIAEGRAEIELTFDVRRPERHGAAQALDGGFWLTSLAQQDAEVVMCLDELRSMFDRRPVALAGLPPFPPPAHGQPAVTIVTAA